MPQPIASPHLVPFDGSFRLADARTAPSRDVPHERALERSLADSVSALAELQPALFAQARHAILLVFQAMDAAGKDGTVRALTTGVNPAGVRVTPFGRPSEEELRHDWLWRVSQRLPERGQIGIFNRSHYEEVLVVRVHPNLLEAQRLHDPAPTKQLWESRYESIRHFEKHLAESGTTILKFWLNVSREEQRIRFLERINEADGHWKFNAGDVAERAHWDDYMAAYEEALRETSRPWAPWYAIPADDKDYARATVADIVVNAIRALDPRFPPFDDETAQALPALRARLESEGEPR